MVEDNQADVDLILHTFREQNIQANIHVASDGVEAINFIEKRAPYEHVPTPGLILLDLNLPKKDGREVLAQIKTNSLAKLIPVVVMTSSEAASDVAVSYALNANAYVTKPIELEGYKSMVQAINDFWVKTTSRVEH